MDGPFVCASCAPALWPTVNAAMVRCAPCVGCRHVCCDRAKCYPTATSVQAYIDAYAAAGLPLVVGEFAREHAGKPVAAAAVMKLAKQRANGYLASVATAGLRIWPEYLIWSLLFPLSFRWSWSGNGGTDAPLDLVFNFNATLPTSWGDMVFADLVTSRPCPVFS